MATVNGAVASTAARERRSSPRYNLLQHGDVVMVDFSSGEPALLVDLGADGMRLQAVGVTPGPDESTSWSFELPAEAGRVEGAGKVIWSKEAGNFGVQFETVVVGRAALEAWLAQKIGVEAALGSHPGSALSSSDTADILAALAQEIQVRHLSFDAALQMIVERVGTATGASGAVVALEIEGAIVCRAGYGGAPEIGTQVDPHSGLTGECVRSGQIVRCDDTETDTRINAALCRAINLRSVAVVPIIAGGQVVGLVEAFSSSPGSFQQPHIELLRGAADVMLDLLTSPSAAAIPSATAELLTQDVPAPVVGGPSSPGFETSRSISLTDEEVARLLEQVTIRDAADDSPGTVTASDTTVPETAITTTVDGLTGVLDQEFEPATPAENNSGSVPVSHLLEVESSNLSAGAAQAAEPGSSLPSVSLLAWISAQRSALAIAAMAVIALAIAGYVVRLRHQAPVQQANPTATTTAPVASVATPAISPVPPAPPPASSKPPASPISEKPTTAGKKQPTTETPTQAPATDSAPVTQLVRQQAPPTATGGEPTPPTLGIVAAQNNGSVSSLLAGSTTVPVRPVLLSSGVVTGGRITSRTEPVYPSNARAMRLQGLVVLTVTVDTSGKVAKIKPVSGHPLLVNAAELAVKQWKYEPFQVSGSPVQTDTTVRITFRLNAP